MKNINLLFIVCYFASVTAESDTQRIRGLRGLASSNAASSAAGNHADSVTRFSNWTDEELREYIMQPYLGVHAMSSSNWVKDVLDDVSGKLANLTDDSWATLIGQLKDSVDSLRTMYGCLQSGGCNWRDWLDQVTAFLSSLGPWIVVLFPQSGPPITVLLSIGRLAARVIVALFSGDSVARLTTSREMLDRIDEKIEGSLTEITFILTDVKHAISDQSLIDVYMAQLTAQMRTLESITDPTERRTQLEVAKELLYRNEGVYNRLSQKEINSAWDKLFVVSTSIRKKDFVSKLPFDEQCRTDDKCLNGAVQNIIEKKYAKARKCHDEMLHVKGLLNHFRDEAIGKFREYVDNYRGFLVLSASLINEVFEELTDEDELRSKHDLWRSNANQISAKLEHAKNDIWQSCGLVIPGFTNETIDENEVRGWKAMAFAQICNQDGFCNFNNFLGRCENEKITEQNTGAVELRVGNKNEVEVCEHYLREYGGSHSPLNTEQFFGNKLFEADHPTKKEADDCNDAFRGSTSWWRCWPERSYPYALPNYCAPSICKLVFKADHWWNDKSLISSPLTPTNSFP